MTPEEREQIKSVLSVALTEMPELSQTTGYGERIVDREAQIAFTAVGQEAPPDIKAAWDPTGEKRQQIARELQSKLADFDILIGGASTIDFTKKNMNKAFGVRWYADRLGVKPEDMLYVGDALYPGGNDEVVILTGIQTRAVSSPLETETVIDELLAVCAA
jgi:hydroxymethylpyrimidine pyrophosphatase-like HAD family hydrolase